MARCRCGAELAGRPKGTRFCSHACYVTCRRADAAESLVARFWAFVKKTPTCWLWTGGTIRGYGQFHLPRLNGNNQTVYAHRYAWTITNGPIAEGQFALHRCDVPLCVNPDHLFLGTQAENLADARAKGRLVDGAHLIKLSDADLAAIRRDYHPRHNGKALAAHYDVSLVTILRVVAGTQRVAKRPRLVYAKPPVFERVPSVQVPVVGELHVGNSTDLDRAIQTKSFEVRA